MINAETIVGRHHDIDKLKLIAEWLYLNELDEQYGDFKPKRLPKFGNLKPGRRWKFIHEALQMWNHYKFVCLVLERNKTK